MIFFFIDHDYKCQTWICISSFHKKGASNLPCMIWQHSILLFLKNKRIINYMDAWDVWLLIWDVVPIISIAFLIIYPPDCHWGWMQSLNILFGFPGYHWSKLFELLSSYIFKLYSFPLSLLSKRETLIVLNSTLNSFQLPTSHKKLLPTMMK